MMSAAFILGVLVYLLPCVISLLSLLLNFARAWKRGDDILLGDLALIAAPFIPLFNILLTLYIVFDLVERINWKRAVISRKKI